MELKRNSMLDYMFVFIPVQLIIITCLTIFYKLRVRWPVKVNCWFCNKNTKIWRKDLNWWLCPFCEQFNGFSKNGDYAYDIPEQYATHNKCIKYCSSPKQNNVSKVPKSNLCISCNKRESLKLLELSNFEPRNENLYNEELKIFKEYLEKKYTLCGSCKSTVQDVLNKQALWLIRYKMLFFKQKSVKAVINNARKSDTIFRLISVVFSSVTIYNHDIIWLPLVGLFFHLCACWASSMKNKNSDILSIIVWFCMIILVLVKNFMALQNVWLTAEHITQYHMIVACTLLIGFLNVKSNTYKNTSTTPVSFKKLKLHTQDLKQGLHTSNLQRKLHTTTPPQSSYDNRNNSNNILKETNSSVESTGSEDELFSSEIKSHLAVPKHKLFTITTCNNDNLLNSYSYCLDNNVSGLSALSLSEDSLRYSAKMPPIFERKVYGTTTYDLFRRSGIVSSRRYILSPPKLRSVTQTSWVAGGYWQEGMMSSAPTLSRSSSQSSGFGSAGSSNFAPSREPSVHEFDRCSVVSDVTQSCYTPRGNVVNPTRSFASLTVPRTQSRCSIFDATMTTTARKRNCSQSQLPSVRACNNPVVTENDVQQKRAIASSANRNVSMPVCSSHTTVVANPGLLIALLCGSLILNMIVLCAMLLR